MTHVPIHQLARGVAAALEESSADRDFERLAHAKSELEAEAQLGLDGPSDGPKLQAAPLGYEPLSPAARDRIAARVLEALGGVPAAQVATSGSPRTRTASESAPAQQALRKRRSSWMLVPVLAAAVAIGLVVLIPERVEPIAHYSVEVVSTRSETRTGSTRVETPRLRPSAGQRVELVLRPETAVSGPVVALAMLMDADANAVPISQTLEVSGTGAIRMELAWPGGAERGTLVLLVGRPGLVTPDRMRLPDGDGWQRFELPFESSPLP